MRDYYRIASMSLVLVSFVMVGCASNIEIQSPPEDQKYLLDEPYDLEIAHTGCGGVVPNSLKAQLDDQDITSAFTPADGTWVASNYELPLGSHTFTARADVVTGQWCYEGRTSDTRQFVVCEPTCIQGTVLAYPQEDPSSKEPWGGARVEIFISTTGRLIGEGVSDESGHFCFDNVPAGIPLNIVVPEQAGLVYEACRGEVDNVPAFGHGTCSEGECTQQGVEAHCYEK